MQRTTAQSINQNQFAVVMEMLRSLLSQGLISRIEADTTVQRIALENELSPIYLW